jgi:hypothetical protein
MVMATSSLPRQRGGLDERRRRVKRGCGEVVCSRSSEHPTQSTEIQPQHAWGATLLTSLSFAPHLARPRGKIGRVSRLQPLILPSGPSHWSTREVRGRILSVMITISFQIQGLEILHLFERVVRAKSARQRASAPKSKNGWEEKKDGAESKKIDIQVVTTSSLSLIGLCAIVSLGSLLVVGLLICTALSRS